MRRALDLFCGAGGMSCGLALAGFDVSGVDINPQPRYPFTFNQFDVLELTPKMLHDFDIICASPPCQDYSTLKGLATEKRPRLIGFVRGLLMRAGKPFIIENVVGSDLCNPVQLCGSMFGLGVWRHRLFETSFPLLVPECSHALCPEPIDVTGTGGPFRGKRKKAGGGVSRKPRNLSHASEVMGINWMTRREISQAVPPAYGEFLGRAAIAHLSSTQQAA